MEKAIRTILLMAILIFLYTSASAQLVKIKLYPNANGVIPGKKLMLALVLDIKEGWHINSVSPDDELLIPTSIHFNEVNFKVEKIIYPHPKKIEPPFYNNPLKVYEGLDTVYAILLIDRSIKNNLEIKGSLKYQGCNDQVCNPLEEVEFGITLPILNNESQFENINKEYFINFDNQIISKSVQKSNKNSSFMDSIEEKGLLISLILIFIGGLGLNLTPCVYPLIPITIGYFGGQAASKKGKKLLMAFLYIMGMTLVNSTLGTVAALTGGMLGSFLANPVVLVFIALVMITLALSMFGLYEIQPPAFILRLGANIGEGYFGALLIGMTMGLVAAPCIGPFVIGLLTYVATTGNPFIGFAMFFTLSLGLGIPFMILAFFSSKISSLPKSGRWMVGIRMFFGFILVAMAIYFLYPLLRSTLSKLIYSLYALGIGIYLILFNKTAPESKAFNYIKNIIAIILIFISGWMIKPVEQKEKLEWFDYNETILEQSIQWKKPVIIDFYADWCIPCKELESITFTDERVINLAKNFTLIKVDITIGDDPIKKELKKKYDIKGVPTIIFISPEGKEIKELRLFGFEDPKKFVQRMKKALIKNQGG